MWSRAWVTRIVNSTYTTCFTHANRSSDELLDVPDGSASKQYTSSDIKSVSGASGGSEVCAVTGAVKGLANDDTTCAQKDWALLIVIGGVLAAAAAADALAPAL